MTLRDHVHAARTRLISAGIADTEAALDAELLARDLLGWDRATWIARQNEAPRDGFEPAFARLIDRRLTREPIAYIRGRQEFYGREFLVTPGVLIPRPETELIIDEALVLLPALGFSRQLTVVDVGTGSGCLVVTLACEFPNARYIATDISESTMDVARENALRHGVADRIEFRHGEYFAGVKGPLNLVVSNPPYVRADERATLPPEVLNFEPHSALFAGAEGLDAIRELVKQAAELLDDDGTLLMEIGYGQLDAVAAAVEDTSHLAVVRARKDLQGIPRLAVIRRCR